MRIAPYEPTKFCRCGECHRKLEPERSYQITVNRRSELMCRNCLIKFRNLMLSETYRRD